MHETATKTERYSKLKIYVLDFVGTSSRACSCAETAIPTPPPGRSGKDHGKGIAEATHIVAVIGTTLDMETDDGDNSD